MQDSRCGLIKVSLMLRNETTMSKVWFTSGLVTRGYYRHNSHKYIIGSIIICAVCIHLPEILWTPIPLLILDGATFLSGKPA